MKKIKLEFDNAAGDKLAGLLELPDQISSIALFAHCFTCGKDIAAASRISRALAAKQASSILNSVVFAMISASWL